MPIENKRGINPPEMDNYSQLLQYYLQHLWQILKEATFAINILPEESVELPTGITIIRMPFPTIYLFFINHPHTRQSQAIIEIDTRTNPITNQYIGVDILLSLFDLLSYYPALSSLFLYDKIDTSSPLSFLHLPIISLNVIQENLSSSPDDPPIFSTYYSDPVWIYEKYKDILTPPYSAGPSIPINNFYPILHALMILNPSLPDENKIARLMLNTLIQLNLHSRLNFDSPTDDDLLPLT